MIEDHAGPSLALAALLRQLLFGLNKQPSDIVPELEGAVETIDNLSRRTFRAGAAYELIVFDRLSPDEQRLLTELVRIPISTGFYDRGQGLGGQLKP